MKRNKRQTRSRDRCDAGLSEQHLGAPQAAMNDSASGTNEANGVRFVIGDDTDRRLCSALKHQFLRCREAYDDFIVASEKIRQGDEGRATSYRAYSAYARFLLHLYELLMACAQRDRKSTAQIPLEQVDTVIACFARRAFARVPASFNSVPVASIETSKKFAEAFRKARHTAMGRIGQETTGFNLSTFYRDHHKYLLSVFTGSMGMCGHMGEEFPDLREVTAFAFIVKND